MTNNIDDVLISIIVPIYNVEKELPRCVESLIGQTHKNLEIILVDDGSPDNCPQMCDEYAKKDSRIRVIHKENGGLSDARNAGILAATGKWLLYVDSDDYIELDSCKKLLAVAEREDVDFVQGAYEAISYTNECQKTKVYRCSIPYTKNDVYSAREFLIYSIKYNELLHPAWCRLYKRDFVTSNNLFFEKGLIFEDTHLLPSLFLLAKKIGYIDYPFYKYVKRDNSIMLSKPNDRKSQSAIKIFNDWKAIFDNVDDLELRAWCYTYLIRNYIPSALCNGILGWQIPGVNLFFALKYAVNLKDFIKLFGFTFAPFILRRYYQYAIKRA